ncbi:MAG: peptidylprolyl isomerase [Alphaproteobacteria bacterium]|nr:peptidylprolyl isomerase [Alphaproteobacteria bacterium]
MGRLARSGILLALAALFFVSAAIQDGRAQQAVMRIAAIVNEDIISMYDLELRARLAIVTNGLNESALRDRRFINQILRTLIDERLQVQEASRLNITVSQRELDREILNNAQRNNMTLDQFDRFTESRGITRAALEDMLESQLAWAKVNRRQLRRQVQISDDEIDEEIARLIEASKKPQKRVSEIFLEIDNPDQDAEIRRTAVDLIARLRQGESFAELARAFSKSRSAAEGGDLGWIAAGQIRPDLDTVLATLEPGQVSAPIQTFTGYYILYVSDTRTASVDPLDAIMSIVQTSIPLPANAAEEERNAARTALQNAREALPNCSAAEANAAGLEDARINRVNDLRLGDMAPALQQSLLSAQAGSTGEPLMTPRAALMITVCERREGGADLPTPDEIRNRLGSERLDLLSRRYMRDLRRDAFIDTRL